MLIGWYNYSLRWLEIREIAAQHIWRLPFEVKAGFKDMQSLCRVLYKEEKYWIMLGGILLGSPDGYIKSLIMNTESHRLMIIYDFDICLVSVQSYSSTENNDLQLVLTLNDCCSIPVDMWSTQLTIIVRLCGHSIPLSHWLPFVTFSTGFQQAKSLENW